MVVGEGQDFTTITTYHQHRLRQPVDGFEMSKALGMMISKAQGNLYDAVEVAVDEDERIVITQKLTYNVHTTDLVSDINREIESVIHTLKNSTINSTQFLDIKAKLDKITEMLRPPR